MILSHPEKHAQKLTCKCWRDATPTLLYGTVRQPGEGLEIKGTQETWVICEDRMPNAIYSRLEKNLIYLLHNGNSPQTGEKLPGPIANHQGRRRSTGTNRMFLPETATRCFARNCKLSSQGGRRGRPVGPAVGQPSQ